MIVAAIVLAFVAGVGVGWLLRGVATARGHTGRMSLTRRLPATYSRPVMIGLVALALLANAVSGFLLIANRSADTDRDRRQRDQVECNATYNRLSGLARDERAVQATTKNKAERDFYTALAAGFASGKLTGPQLVERIRAYRREIDKTLTTNLDNPYPPPGLCDDGRATPGELTPRGSTP